ncbi:MAG TPA: hypothetical protein VLG37_02635 [Candidatus Saccharimonadales bacterium]|nr:hypothetical protein [Candidatus Saccharimonadales bacterium]
MSEVRHGQTRGYIDDITKIRLLRTEPMTSPYSLNPLDGACYEMTLMLDGIANAALCRTAAKAEVGKRQPFSPNVTIVGNPTKFLQRAEGFELFVDLHRARIMGYE